MKLEKKFNENNIKTLTKSIKGELINQSKNVKNLD